MDEGTGPSISRAEDATAAEKLAVACYRCRQRKVKCDRANPCSYCVKAGERCSYATPRPRERRRRVMVSQTYDSKLDDISRKIDELSQRLAGSQLSQGPEKVKSGQSTPAIKHLNAADPVQLSQDVGYSSPSLAGPTPAPSLGSASNHLQEALHFNSDSESVRENAEQRHAYNLRAEFEGQSSLFSHASFATRFLQSAIGGNGTGSEITIEMKTILEDLRAAVRSGKEKSGFSSLEELYPHAQTLPPGSTTRDLPLPLMDKVFTCLRMAKECSEVGMLWLGGNFLRPSQFTEYLIKVASPGSASEAYLVIVHCGLYWLFCECSKAAAGTNENTKQDHDSQAFICQKNLETVLANLHFHQAASMDGAYAMGMAALYCLQKSNPTAAWGFICSASQMVQTLGLQHDLPAGCERSEERTQKSDLFWTIYMVEKMLSQRLGRSSTLRDQDITLARPNATQRPSGSNFLSELAPGWVTVASIQGRIYDEIYSPRALMQQPHIRTARARALAAELQSAMQRTQLIHDTYSASKGHVLGSDYHEISKRSDRVLALSMLTLIYRSIAPEEPSLSAFCQESIAAARETLAEHDRCVTAIIKAAGKTVYLEAYINWAIMYSPFIPFIILFCHVVEAPEASALDLHLMRRFVETVDVTPQSRPNTHAQIICGKQQRLFKALYGVAAKYVEVKANTRAEGGQGKVPDSQSNILTMGNDGLDTAPRGTGMPTAHNSIPTPSQSDAETGGIRFMNNYELTGSVAPQSTTLAFGDIDMNMEIDIYGAELWNWFDEHQSIIRILEG